ncbi:MAG: AAA family ATPase [Alphaproteobacteria bacterium]|nr:AAA family ATPase [Alphaproteobacteria bacterium]
MRIAIIGPEASGKTELAATLARHFGGTATEEYARRYFAERALPADYALNREEMCEVMAGQQAAEQGEGLLFIDSSTIHGPLYAGMTHVEGKLVFDFTKIDAKIMDYATNGGYDAFVLCRPHAALGWNDDGMRAMPELEDRNAFADACAAFVARYFAGKPCIVVDAGIWQQREAQARTNVKKLLG